MAKLNLRESDFGYKSGDRYYGGLPAEPDYEGPGKRARYWKELIQYFKTKVREYPEYYVIGTSPVAVTLKTPDGKETIDLTKFDALADADEAIEMASHYFDESLFEARKKKKNGALVNPDAGNVEHNIEMFNKMNSPVDGPSNNPISGPFGGDVCAESLDEAAEDVGKATEYIVLKKWNSDILRNRKCWYPRMYAVLRRNERGAWIRAHGFAEDTFVPERDIVASYDNYEDADKHLRSLDDIIYEGLSEAMPKKETIELEYKNLEFTQYGAQRDADDWDEWDRCMDWTYEVDKDDLYTFIFESCIDETDFPEAFEDDFDPNNAEHWARFESWLDDNFDTIYSKYEEKILENWEEDAQEEAAEEYDPDDYVDWDSMPGGHDDDRYWEGLNEECKREPRMIDYFEQMNSEDDEA